MQAVARGDYPAAAVTQAVTSYGVLTEDPSMRLTRQLGRGAAGGRGEPRGDGAGDRKETPREI